MKKYLALLLLFATIAFAAQKDVTDGTVSQDMSDANDNFTELYSYIADLQALTGAAFLDEDDMASDSAVSVPSQQSVKAYVDNQTQDDIGDGSTYVQTENNFTDAEKALVAGAIQNTGNETVAGVKTFSSFPVTPSSAPTTDYQVANKKYVDDNSGTGDVTRQDIAENVSGRGPAYYFDGTNDYISLGTSTELDPGMGDCSIIALVNNSGNDGVENRILNASGTDWMNFTIDSTGYLKGSMGDGTTRHVIGSTDIGADGLDHWLEFTLDRSSTTGMKLYIDGTEETYTQQDDPTALTEVAPTSTKYMGTSWSASSNWFSGDIRVLQFWNMVVPDAVRKSMRNSGGVVPFRYQGASQTALTSGTLTVGLHYTIDTFVAGDDFTNVGAASNASGVEFVATGTTPTTWTNSSSLRHTGCVADFNPRGATPSYWYSQYDTWSDTTPTGIKGTVSGATLVNNFQSIYVEGPVSASAFTDRTKFFEGDALAEIAKIKSVNGMIDHASLPEFVQKKYIQRDSVVTYSDPVKIAVEDTKIIDGKLLPVDYEIAKDQPVLKEVIEVEGELFERDKTITPTETEVIERDIGGSISMNTVAIQQLWELFKSLDAVNDAQEARIKALETAKEVTEAK